MKNIKNRIDNLGIIQVVTHLGPGGIQSLSFSLAIKLAEQGYRSEILAYSPVSNNFQKNEMSILEKYGVVVYIPKKILKNKYERFKYSNDVIKKCKANIIHSHGPIPPIYLCIPSKIYNKILIQTFHSTKLWRNRTAHLKGMVFLQLTQIFIKKYIAISKTIKEIMILKYHIKERKIDIIYNGIDEINQNSIENKNDILFDNIKDKFIISHISTIDFYNKSQHKVLKMFIQLSKNSDNFALLFVGEGRDYEKLKEMIKDKKDVYALGNRSDIRHIIEKSNIIILPSKFEGFPMIILEALAMNKIVIASDVGSNKEIIFNKKDGFLFNYNNFNELKEIIFDIYNNKNIEKNISRNAKEKIKMFTFKKCYNMHLKLYKKLIRTIISS